MFMIAKIDKTIKFMHNVIADKYQKKDTRLFMI